jgi:bacterioferritin
VDLLSDDLSIECQSIVQYNLHISTVTGSEFVSTIDELAIHLTQELQHARVLAQQVSCLGGTPTTTVREVPTSTSAREALNPDLRLEREQLERYRARSAAGDRDGLGRCR